MKALVCVWDPHHTLEIVTAQQEALASGLFEHLEREAERRSVPLPTLLHERGLMTVTLDSDRKTPLCAFCDTPMEELDAPEATTKLDAVKAIAADVGAAIDRARRGRP
jgi:hypothetical protein